MNDAARLELFKKRTNDSELRRHCIRLAAFVDSEMIAVVDDVRGCHFFRVNISHEVEELADGSRVGRARLFRDRFVNEGSSQCQVELPFEQRRGRL